MSRHYRHGQCAFRTDFRAAGHCVGGETAFGVCAGGKCSDPDAYRRRRKSSFRVKAQKLLINGCPVEAILAVGAKLDAALVPAVLAIDAARPQRSANLP